MASPPASRATSPPQSTPLALPRQRPSLALPTGFKTRQPSSAVSTPSGLRQASFPPEDSQQRRGAQDRFSPIDDDSIGDLSDDGEIKSAISGPGDDDGGPRKRKRGEKRSRGRPPKQYSGVFRQGSASVVNGEDGKSTTGGRRSATAGAGSAANGEGEEEEEEDDDAGARDAKDGFNIDKEELERERERRFLFREAVNTAHQSRYDSYNRVKLKQADVRRLVNATLSQSVPQNVVTVVMAYTKMFAGMLIESAKEVQDEWLAAEEKRPDGEESRIFKRLRMMQPDPEEDEVDEVEQEQAQEVPAGADKEKTEQEKAEKETEKAENEQAEKEKAEKEMSENQKANEEQAEKETAEKETSENQKANEEQAEKEKSSKDDGDQIMDETDDVTADKDEAKPTDDAQKAKHLQESSNVKTEEESEPPIKKENDQDDDEPMPDPPNLQVDRSSTSENTSQPHTQPGSNTTTIANSTQETVVKKDQTSAKSDSAHISFDEDEVTSAANVQPGAGNLAKFMDEVDRGPLLPDHFREAVRRYRKARDGGTTGFTGLSLEGRENAAVRSGGRKLFR